MAEEDWGDIYNTLGDICREIHRILYQYPLNAEEIVRAAGWLLPQRWSVLRKGADGSFVTRWPIPETETSKLARMTWNFLDALENMSNNAATDEVAAASIISAFQQPYFW